MIVEALRAGRLGVGSDVSPLSLFVSRGRTWIASDSELEELREVRHAIDVARLSSAFPVWLLQVT